MIHQLTCVCVCENKDELYHSLQYSNASEINASTTLRISTHSASEAYLSTDK